MQDVTRVGGRATPLSLSRIVLAVDTPSRSCDSFTVQVQVGTSRGLENPSISCGTQIYLLLFSQRIL
jgi:hypothetical protein